MQRRAFFLFTVLLACGTSDEDSLPNATPDGASAAPVADQEAPTPPVQAAKEGVLFESELGGYSVRFPSQPKTQTEPLGTLPDGTTLNIEITMLEAPTGLTLGATLTEVPPFPEERIQSALDDGVKGAVANVPGAQLDSVESIEIKGHPGRSFKMYGTVEGLEFEGRQVILYKNGSLVQFMSIAPKGLADDPSIETFFQSIEHK
jgi:hypothetical protein